ncbi:Aminopeptidase 2 [Jeotgalicoccus aerolatus]|uniref:Aminopeptidase n=1 Tax=Jeotgalicoccus aerolatus TaxID=709510 RepID=A0ABS4HQ38_9STAP|nr:aminopeptidase [Jeotgalicoccus aerolatus]MBP1952724.1 aminopeptidase [Jeotgalicoccus aerolatus]GGE08665.1 aminopeptidase AmpS [Jeotgalicoccus aerolatus]CAD2080906.1 Aminopeptidase 2 [Jeotgalicoccus aerolatus]HJG33799.1 aminopeptidase [Jeotgalicoccus aerolatus]
MMNIEEKLYKYAELLVDVGINITNGKRLYIRATTDALPLVRLVTKIAYERGSKEVKVSLGDDTLSRLNAEYRSEEELSVVHDFQVAERMYYSDEKAGFLSIISSSPELLKDVAPSKLQAMQVASGQAFKEFSARTQSDFHSWCVAGYPSVEWARLVYPELPDDEAVDALLELVLYTVRADLENPVEAWFEHDKTLHEKVDYLNDKQFTALRYEAPGTDLTIGLPVNHLWAGASSTDSNGDSFMANMPTEEVFTAPDKNRVDGYVSNTLPLSHGGNIIDDFKLTFKDGEVVEYEAGRGYDILKNIIDTDQGSKRLGEVALVPADSPISNEGILFYNTLFDENASCHIALGSAYAFSIEGGKEMSREALDEAGLNDSITHVDFMIGSEKLNIFGIDQDGNESPVFTDGNWAF